MKKIWFKRKEYGWGWYPVTKEGWMVIAIWILLFVSIVPKIEIGGVKYFSFIAIMIGMLLFICYKKGEAPKWRWGEKDKKE